MNRSKTQPWWLPRLQTLFDALGSDVSTRQPLRGVRVRRLDIHPSSVIARLNDRELGDGTVEIHVPLLKDEQWAAIFEQMSDQAFFAAQLLVDQLPAEIESVFAAVGVSLIPQQAHEVVLKNSYDPAGPARILAAVYSALVEMVRSDPWLLFLLRGRHRDSVLLELRRARSETTPPVPITSTPTPSIRDSDTPYIYRSQSVLGYIGESLPVSLQIDSFWGNSRQLRALHHYVSPPAVELALLRRLGPLAQTQEWEAFHHELSELYRQVTENSLALAYEVEAEPEVEGGK